MEEIASIRNQITNHSNVVAIANAANLEVLKTVKLAIEDNLCGFQLYGEEKAIRAMANEIHLDVASPNISIIQAPINDVCDAAVEAVHNQEAHVLMKGDVSTKNLLQAVLHKDKGLRTGNVLSHVALFEIPGRKRVIFLTDAAMNIAPRLQEKAQIIQNAVFVANSIGVKCPKVAAIAPVEVVNEAIPSTVDAALLTQMQKRGQLKNCIVDGPLQFDIAVSTRAKEEKQVESDVAGETDILLVPSLETGNALYKAFTCFANAKVAAMVGGASAPIVLTSRADSAPNKLLSLYLALAALKTF
ncbi:MULTISPECIES: phosphate acyltransferase [unclassified Virgibacillus]|uniref:phosphate acyltransferase n=1 Tax=unclassified Virgibacillus TaxID=2620237 RepID=UPI0024DE6FC4|nr:phosphate acyltransferase [Virgibacillus sp. LDC-1]